MTDISPAPRRKLGPYSKVLRRGVISNTIDGRSTLGRYCRDLERQLCQHIGGSPSIAQKLLIERLIKTTVQLNSLDEKLAAGEWSGHDERTHGGLINRQRLLLREIGLEPPPPPVRSFDEIMADIAQRRASEAA